MGPKSRKSNTINATNSDDNSSQGQIIRVGTEDGGSSLGDMASANDMASVGNMELDMASIDDDQSGPHALNKSMASPRGSYIIGEDDEEEVGQSFDEILMKSQSVAEVQGTALGPDNLQ